MNFRRTVSTIAWLLLISFAMAHTAAAQNAQNRPLIRAVFVDLDTDMLFINGLRFGDTPRLALFGLPDGSIVRLATPFWTNTAITAELPTSEPGNYKLVIITGTNKRDQMGVTIGESFVKSLVGSGVPGPAENIDHNMFLALCADINGCDIRLTWKEESIGFPPNIGSAIVAFILDELSGRWVVNKGGDIRVGTDGGGAEVSVAGTGNCFLLDSENSAQATFPATDAGPGFELFLPITFAGVVTSSCTVTISD